MDAKIDQLISKLIEQQLEPAELEALQTLLRSDDRALEQYLKMLEVHTELSEALAPVRAFSAEELLAIQAIDEKLDRYVRAESEHTGAGDSGSHDDESTSHPITSSAAAPSVVHRHNHPSTVLAWSIAAASLAAMVGLLLWPKGDTNAPTNTMAHATPAVATSDSVATVIRKVDCDWEEDRWRVTNSAAIKAGQQINLSRGLLVLKFNSGPEVTLSGRTTFVATSATSAQLIQGTLSARVPEQGRGFKVETHAGDFVDLGTEFGMIITEEGSVETHVFKGQVRAEPSPTRNAKSEHVLLEKGQAWSRAEPGGTNAAGVSQPQRFMLPLEEGSVASGTNIPVTDKLALWFDAARATQRDADGRVYAWGNLAAEDREKAIDAWQVEAVHRPTWNAKALNGHPALHFNGDQGLVTEPLSLSPSHTSAVVFQLEPREAIKNIRARDEYRYLGVQLLNLNGPPHTVLQVNENLTLESRVHRGWLKDNVDPVDVGVIRTLEPLGRGHHIAAYTYDSEKSKARLWLDGKLVAESNDAPRLQGTSAPRFLGAHFERAGFGFTGYISEFVVLDKPLTDEEMDSLNQWLDAKYATPPVSSDSSTLPLAIE